jgi:RecB family exonuclease
MASFDDLVPGEALTVSATLYTTYRQCPQQALGRLQGLYPPTTRASFKGSLAHRIFARHLQSGPIETGEFELVCRSEAGANLGEAMASLHMKPSEFRAVVAEISDLYEQFDAIPLDGFIEAEAPLEVEPAPGVRLRGRVDAVFGEESTDRVRIVDWKTGVDISGSGPQLDFYAMAWAEVHGSRPAVLEALSIRTGEKVVRTPAEIDLDRVRDEVVSMIGELRAAIETGVDLERIAGPYCRWCPLLDDCPEGSTAMRILE